MAYQYETSPRKRQPDYDMRRKTQRIKDRKDIYNKQLEEEERQKRELEEKRKRKLALKQEKKQHHKNIALIIGGFLLLLAISYRNSLITERFSEIQNMKQELSAVQKTNEQTQVSIESSLNLKNVEQSAQEKLGMQKLDKSQKVYITLPKEDYTEIANENAISDSESEKKLNWFQKIINKFFH